MENQLKQPTSPTKNLKFSFWRARPHLPRNQVSKNPVMMEKLVELANKGVRARIQATIKSFAQDKAMEGHIGQTFLIVDNQVRFKCSDAFGEAFKQAYPRLNVIQEK